MPTTGDRPARRQRSAIALALSTVLALAGLTAAPALGATEAQQGAQLLRSLQTRQADCSSLATADFDRIGEYVMERMLGSSAAHEAMNRQMAAVMGSRGETQAHVYMGQRFAGCATGRAPATFGAMMGMMGSAYGGGSPSTMMGSGARGTSGMMGSDSPSSSRDDAWSSGDTVMVVLMGLLVALAIGALVAWRPWRRRAVKTPLETLQGRYARGEIDQQEFDRRRQALGGTA